MALYHVYSQTVADGTATSVVRPSDWNSAHSQAMTLAGNTVGASTLSGTNVVYQGGNNVTLSVNQGANAATVVVSGPSLTPYLTTAAQSNHSHNFATTTTNGANIVVGTANSAGATIGVPAYLTTAQPVGAYLTTARASNDAVGLNTALTANGVSWTVNSSGISLNVPAFLTTAAQSNHSHNFATTTTNGSQIVVGTANSAGATIGVPPFITTYVAQTTQTQPAGNIAGVGTTFGGTNVSATMGFNSNGLALSLSAPTPGGGGAINVSAGTTSGNLQTVQFDNANGVTFGLNGSTVTASVNAGGAVTVNGWEPFPPIGGGVAFTTLGQNTIYMQRLVPTANIAFNNIERRLSGSTTATSNATHTAAHTISYGLYALGTGTNNTRYESLGTSSMYMAAFFSGTVSAGVTVSQGTGSYTTTSGGTGILSLVGGFKHLYMPFQSTMTAGGNYAVLMNISSATTGGSSALRIGVQDLSVINNLTIGKLFGTTLSSTNASFVGDFAQGVYSATSAGLPANIALSGFTNAVSQQRMYLQFDA